MKCTILLRSAVALYAKHEMGEMGSILIEHHLKECDFCRQTVEQLRNNQPDENEARELSKPYQYWVVGA